MQRTASVNSAGAVKPWRVSAVWQATPYTLVFVLFFLVPLSITLAVSFWDFNDY